MEFNIIDEYNASRSEIYYQVHYFYCYQKGLADLVSLANSLNAVSPEPFLSEEKIHKIKLEIETINHLIPRLKEYATEKEQQAETVLAKKSDSTKSPL